MLEHCSCILLSLLETHKAEGEELTTCLGQTVVHMESNFLPVTDLLDFSLFIVQSSQQCVIMVMGPTMYPTALRSQACTPSVSV